MQINLPQLITVKAVTNGRYAPGTKPMLWDERVSGIEEVVAEEGEVVRIYSSGGQSTPAPGWKLLLTQLETASDAYSWTLYGIGKP